MFSFLVLSTYPGHLIILRNLLTVVIHLFILLLLSY